MARICRNMRSSPRLRGTHREPLVDDLLVGIIPALAGNTSYLDFEVYGRRDHPRARGEHSLILNTRNVSRGSSPRLRGTRPAPPAGKPAPPEESSSRLRGTPNETGRACPRRGIIPALAGNTCRPFLPPRIFGDHPRACGEHSSITSNTSWILGSSPRLRGTLKKFCMFPYSYGIIPALAGNTSDLARAHRFWRDHPRACGEHVIGVNPEIAALGSSPRLRGTHIVADDDLREAGIIPALAGNTSRVKFACTVARDHPRACGEHGS